MISVVYCTRTENKKHQEHLVKSSGLHKHIEVIEIINNGESLTKAFNRGLKQAKNDIVVFCHDDITIETKQWGKKLEKLFNNNEEFGIIGVAGTKHMSETGRWWDKPQTMFGRVKHTHEGKSWLSSYSDDLGDNIEETIIVDGVWFAVNKSRLKKDFDESVEGFHFYDVDFCMQNRLEGVKVGVITKIRINHMSIGQTNQEWEDNRKIFADKYKDELPITIHEDFKNGKKLNVIIPTVKEGDLDRVIELGSELTKLDVNIGVVSKFNRLDITKCKRSGVRAYSLQEPPGFKIGDGKFAIQTQNGPVVSEVNKLYKVSASQYNVIVSEDQELISSYKQMYPECKFVNTNSDEFITMEKTPENYKKLFIKTYNE